MGIKLSKVDFTYSRIKKNSKKAKNIIYANKGLNLEINNNDEFIAIVGHTGSGKSTLVQLFNSLLIPTNGQIDINFRENKQEVYYSINANGKKTKYAYSLKEDNMKYKNQVVLKPLRRHIGLVFQFPEYQIFEETVLKDIMFGPKNFVKDEKYAENKAKEIAEMMGITNLLDKSPFALSGGQMRKVAIAGILASEPDILVLDEPTVGLDPLAKRELLTFLSKLNKEEHKTIILITHDMDVVGEFAKRVIVLKKGEIQYDGLKEDLFKNDEILQNCNLSCPNIVNILKGLKNKTGMDIDVYQYNITDAYKEIERKLGGNNE